MIYFIATALTLASTSNNATDSARSDTYQFQKYGNGVETEENAVFDVVLAEAGSSNSLLDLLGSVRDELSDGDRRRFAPLNLAYQLACYQGVGGTFQTQGRWGMEKYTGYGCYCNKGVYSGNNLDATDQCCQTHESCYNRVMAKYKLNRNCKQYTTKYTVSCCKDQKQTKCTDSGPSVERELCECDQAMASCAATSADSYNKELLNNRDECTQEFTSKPLTPMEILNACKHDASSAVKFPTIYGSQGSCGE